VPVVVLAVGAALASWFLFPSSIDNAQVGDCASFDRSNPQSPYAAVRCGSSAAAFTVLQVINGEGNCRDVAGATRSTIKTDGNNRREVCLGPRPPTRPPRSTSPRSVTASPAPGARNGGCRAPTRPRR
jgi:hypothetical protein